MSVRSDRGEANAVLEHFGLVQLSVFGRRRGRLSATPRASLRLRSCGVYSLTNYVGLFIFYHLCPPPDSLVQGDATGASEGGSEMCDPSFWGV